MDNFFSTLLKPKDRTQASNSTNALATLEKQNSQFNMIIFGIICVVFVISAVFIVNGFSKFNESSNDAFNKAKEKAQSEAYNKFYETSFDYYEEKHHVKNTIAISIDSVVETSILEVLNVQEVIYETQEQTESSAISNFLNFFKEENVTAWLEVYANGVFTVDLQKAEFITEDEHQWVLVRLPEPQLTQFSIDYEKTSVLYFEDSGLIKNSADVGAAFAREKLASAEQTLSSRIVSNQNYHESAKNATKQMLESLIKQANQDAKELVVEIEFFT